MRIERELMRGAGPVAVLRLLRDREMYGYEVVTALAQTAEGVLAMGQSTLYPMLYNLEAKGLVEGHWRSGDTGRDRKYYRLTAKGHKRLAADIKQWNALAGALTGLGVIEGAPSPAAQGVVS